MSTTIITRIDCDFCANQHTGLEANDAQVRQARSAARSNGWRHTRSWDICPNHPDITNYNLKDRKHT